MKKDVAIFSALLGAILLLGYGVYAYLYRNDERSPTYEKSVQEESTSQLENDFIEVPVLTFINERNTEASQKYTTDISYPSIALVGHSSLAKEANTVIKTFALDMLREFQKNIEEDTVDLSNAGADSGSDFTMRSNPTLLSPTIVSLRFDSVEYFAGAAHPNHQTRVLNYDIETHRIISTLDLFASSSSALPFLSTKTRENLS